MKRTEDVFEFSNNCELRVCYSGVELCGRHCGHVYITPENIPDLIAALQQFKETRTFVKPKRYDVVKDISPSSESCKIQDKRCDGPVQSGTCTLWLPRDKAQRIADILNEEEE